MRLPRDFKLQSELVRLQKELDLANASHEKEMEKAKKGFKKLIAEYKVRNLNFKGYIAMKNEHHFKNKICLQG